MAFGARYMVAIAWLAQVAAARYRLQIVVQYNNAPVKRHRHARPFQIIGQPGLVAEPKANRGQKAAAI